MWLNEEGALSSPTAKRLAHILRQDLQPADLLRAVHCTAQYLWFISSEAFATGLQPCSGLLSLLASEYTACRQPLEGLMHRESPSGGFTSPGSQAKEGWSSRSSSMSLHVCMRSVLETLWERLGSLPNAQGRPDPRVLRSQPPKDVQLPPRLLQLCCPLLDQARLALQVGPEA